MHHDHRQSSLSLSVVLLGRDEEKHLPGTLAALEGQRDCFDELVLVDDGSQDASVEILSAYALGKVGTSLVCHEVPAGLVGALNTGLQHCTGDLVYFLAADDLPEQALLSSLSRLFAENGDIGVASARSRIIDEDGSHLADFETPVPLRRSGVLTGRACRDALYRHGSWFMGNALIFRRQALEDIGGFDETLAGFADGFAAWTLALRHGAGFTPEFLARKRSIEDGAGVGLHRDPGLSAQVWAHAQELMRGPCRDVYDDKLIRRCAGRWRYQTMRATAYKRWGRGSMFVLMRVLGILKYCPYDLSVMAVRRARRLA